MMNQIFCNMRYHIEGWEGKGSSRIIRGEGKDRKEGDIIMGVGNDEVVHIQQMILQPEHKHQQNNPKDEPPSSSPPHTPPAAAPPQRQSTPSNPTIQYPIQPQSPSIFQQMLTGSEGLLNSKGRAQIRELIKYRQEKVSLSYQEQPNSYLQHLMKDPSDSHQLLSDIIGLTNDIFTSRIESGNVRMQQRNSIAGIKDELTTKITDMRKKIFSLSVIDKKVDEKFANVMQFRKKGYWMAPSEQNQHVKSFLRKMKRVNSQHKKAYERSFQKRESIVQRSIERERKEHETHRKQMMQKELEKMASLRKDREHYYSEQKKKREKIEAMLQKLTPGQPTYLRKQQQFKKNYIQPLQQQRQRKLQQIRSSHQPLDAEQLDQHAHRYEQYKQNLLEQHKRKEQQESDLKSKQEQELKELYHGKFHKDIMPRFYNSEQVARKEHRKKIKEFGAEVLEKYRPQVDPRKRAKVEERILELSLSEDKSKQIVRLEDGSTMVQERPSVDGRKMGVGYLSQLREYNEGKPRKQTRCQSMMQLTESSKVKRIDYLRESRPNIKLKKTMGEWKKVLQDDGCSNRQKYEAVMEQAGVMEAKAKRKEVEMRGFGRGEKAMRLKEEMDRYYMESVAAKMVVLKDVILKD